MAEREMSAPVNFDSFAQHTHERRYVEANLNLSHSRSIPAGMSENPNAGWRFFRRPGCEINELVS